MKNTEPYDLVASFHEDTEDPYTYFYETGEHSNKMQIDEWRKKVKEIGLNVLNGLDDPNDPALGYSFDQGYNYELEAYYSGAFEHWVVADKFSARCLNFEIPVIATMDQKEKSIENIFENLIIPEFRL